MLCSLRPQTGSCLLFLQQGVLHEGEEVSAGVKHILATDVMFRRRAGSAPQRTPAQREALLAFEEASRAEARRDPQTATQLYRKAFKLDPELERSLFR